MKNLHELQQISKLYIKQSKKLKRTVESGHSYKYPIVFNTIEDLERWEEEDKLYED